jgi:hypothetical protein
MGKRGRVLIALAAVAVLAVLAWTMLHTPAPEPVYNGKPLSYWLRGYGYSYDTNLPSSAQADAALREIGTNAVPTLLRMLRAHDSPLKTRFLKWAFRYRYFRINYPSAGTINLEACHGFRALGPNAYGAVPELIRVLDEKASPNLVSFSAMALAGIGPDAHAAVPSLLRMAVTTNENLRNSAFYALGQIHADPRGVIPVLARGLHDPSPMIRAWAASGLGNFGPDAISAVPELVAILNEPTPNSNSVRGYRGSNVSVRDNVEPALRQIDPETYARVITNNTQAPTPYR